MDLRPQARKFDYFQGQPSRRPTIPNTYLEPISTQDYINNQMIQNQQIPAQNSSANTWTSSDGGATGLFFNKIELGTKNITAIKKIICN